jgi:peptidoglycan/LPS O-acetylase OafA/YrhL
LAAIAWVGRLSYSIYIWQQIFWMDPKIYGLGNVWWMSFPGWLVPVMIVASISYYGLEMPFLKLREFFRRNNQSAAVPQPNYLSK